MDEKNLAELLRKLVGDVAIDSYVAKIVSVEGRTCTVVPVSSLDENEESKLIIPNIRLNANIQDTVGLLTTPAENSFVLVTKLSETDAFVSLFSEVERVQLVVGERTLEITSDAFIFNDNALNSYMCDINNLVGKVNILEQNINDLKTAMTAWVPVPQDGGAGLKAGITSWAAQQIVKTKVNDIKDETIKN